MLSMGSAPQGDAPTILFYIAVVLAFTGYPAASIYALTATSHERARRMLTTFPAIGVTIVGILTIAHGILRGSPLQWIVGIAALVASENLLLIEIFRRLWNRDPFRGES